VAGHADQKTLIGASGAGADSDVFPIVLRNLFQPPMRVVTGFRVATITPGSVSRLGALAAVRLQSRHRAIGRPAAQDRGNL
jgi:hypothetical protein